MKALVVPFRFCCDAQFAADTRVGGNGARPRSFLDCAIAWGQLPPRRSYKLRHEGGASPSRDRPTAWVP